MATQGFNESEYLTLKLNALVAADTDGTWTSTSTTDDVMAAFTAAGLTAEQHYEQYGASEGLGPNASFNVNEYLTAKLNALVAADTAGTWTSTSTIADLQTVLDDAGFTAYSHYTEYGSDEGFNPSNDFDASSYLEDKLAALIAADTEGTTWNSDSTTDDVMAAFTAAGLSVLGHYELYGNDEGLGITEVPPGEQVTVSNPGEIFTLTTDVDKLVASDYELAEGETEDDVTRTTDDDDTIDGVTSALSSAKTLNATDIIDAGDGNDSLDVTMNASHTGMTGTGAISNVENISLTNAGTINRTFDATGITGATAYAVDGTTGGVSISDLDAIPTVSLSDQASGAFSTAMDTTFVALAGAADAMTLNIDSVGTAAVAASTGVTAVTEASVTATLTSMETVNISATGTNVIANAGTNTALTVGGAGDVKVTSVATSLTSFDGSESTGALTVDVTNTAATLTSVATGSGDDTLTFDEVDANANATLAGGTGTDSLTLNSNGGTVQYTMSGFETMALGTVGTAGLTFSGTNVTDLTTVSTKSTSTTATSLVNMGAVDLTVNGLGATVDGGDLSSTHTGATVLNYTADAASVTAQTIQAPAADFTFTGSTDLTVNVGEYIDVATGDSVITAAAATSVALNIASGKNSAGTEITEFGGTITAVTATDVAVTATGTLAIGSQINAAAATSATITTTGAVAGGLDLQAALLESLTVNAAAGLDMSSTALTTLQVANITTAGFFDMVDEDLAAISSLTVGGTSTAARANFGALGGDIAYDMDITATGLALGLLTKTVNVGAGYDVAVDASGVTGLVTIGNIGGTTEGADVSITTAGTGGAVTIGTVDGTGTITITNSSVGVFEVGTVGAADFDEDVVIALDGTTGLAQVGTVYADNVNIDVSNTIGGFNGNASDSTTWDAIHAQTSVTLALSELQANTVGITAGGTSTAFTAAITGGIDDDTITITGDATTTSVTVTGDLGIGTNLVTTNLVDSSAAQTVTLTGLSSSATAGDTTFETKTIMTAETSNALTYVGSVKDDEITMGAGNSTAISITDATTTDSDSLVLGAVASVFTTMTISGIEKITVGTSTVSMNASALTGDTVNLTNTTALTLTGTTGNDTIDLTNLTTSGVAANLKVDLSSNGANAVLIGANVTGATVTGGSGVDTITIAGGTNEITTGAGADVIIATAGTNTIIATNTVSETTTITATSTGTTVNMTGAAAATVNASTSTALVTINGTDGQIDTIVGGSGGDTIDGGTFDDVITLGSGADTIVYESDDATTVDSSAFETVTGYTLGTDIIKLAATSAVQDDGADKYASGLATGAVATSIADDTTISDALIEALGTTHADNAIFAFVWSGDTYVIHADSTSEAGNVIQLVGVTATSIAEVGTTDTFILS